MGRAALRSRLDQMQCLFDAVCLEQHAALQSRVDGIEKVIGDTSERRMRHGELQRVSASFQANRSRLQLRMDYLESLVRSYGQSASTEQGCIAPAAFQEGHPAYRDRGVLNQHSCGDLDKAK